ncbi:Oidioi.mRNA.OKI2018_I69.chr2.g8268.t1.cds [Oikopleura dioica]|uniref:Oidioi.mRNA.OKI2018_I69.chr2.g8268.t1.cds n=1 Tax=Oikopleura dioica TaxID=34765 RepID=A0ABN7T9P6_OIKDI|nr:Oidioi.mRNA.OKI2018_I69.chr2.g8268.t1.cds [Oikopleura dioica]
MKIAQYLFAVAQASDYQTGYISYLKGDPVHDAKLNYIGHQASIERRMGWQRSSAGFAFPGCTEEDIFKGSLSDSVINETVVNFAGEVLIEAGKSGTTGQYYVDEMDDSDKLESDAHYCFGKKKEGFLVSEPFIHRGQGCCITDLTDDDGNSVGGEYKIEAKVYDLDNKSPSIFGLPNRWNIMFGCQNQQLELAPHDPDSDDEVRCRWATFDEAKGMARVNGTFDSLVLDETLCTITYVPELNKSPGFQPIAIQIEDFDIFGNIKSSMPVQLRANIWTPDAEFPTYWMTCTEISKFTGHSWCTWRPSSTIDREFCAVAYDPMNRNTERVCVSLAVQSRTHNAPECNVCSGAGKTSAETYSDCKNSMVKKTCRYGDICGVEVRMNRGEVTQLDMRCKNEYQCIRNMNNNFQLPVTKSACRPEPHLQTRYFGQSTCSGCLRACENFTAYLVQYLEFNGSYVPLMTYEAQELVCEHVTFENYTHPDPVLFNRTAKNLTTTHGVNGQIPFTEDSIPEVSLTTSGGSKLGEKMTLKGVTSFGTSGPGVILVNCTIRMDNRTFQIIENKEITSIGHLLRGELRCDHGFEFRRFSTSPDTGKDPKIQLKWRGLLLELHLAAVASFILVLSIETASRQNGKDIYQCEGSTKKVVWGSKWGMWSGGGYYSLGTSAHDSRCLGDYGEFEGADYVWQNGYQLKLECLIYYPKIY